VKERYGAMHVPGHSGLSSGFSVGFGVVVVVVVVVGCLVGGGGLKGGLESRSGSVCGRLNRGANIFTNGISWLAVSGFPVTPVSRSGPNVVNNEDISGPFGFGFDGMGSLLGGSGRRGGGGVLSLDGSL